MDKLKKYNRIRYLERKYSETNVAQDEILAPATVQKINKKYNDNQRKRRVDAILNNVKNKDLVKEEVHKIVDELPSIDILCQNCKEEVIISCIILYVMRARNKQYRVERTSLWNTYNITWQKYALIISNLLKETRKNRKL